MFFPRDGPLRKATQRPVISQFARRSNSGDIATHASRVHAGRSRKNDQFVRVSRLRSNPLFQWLPGLESNQRPDD